MTINSTASRLGGAASFAPEQAKEGIFTLDRKGRFCFVNPWLASLLGYRTEELLGTPLEQLVSARHKNAVHEAFKQMLRGGEHLPIQLDLLRRGDDCVPVVVHAWPVREREQIIGIQGTCHQRYAPPVGTTGTAVGEDMYRALFDMASEAILVTDRTGKVVLANDATARMFGYSTPQALVGKKGVSLYARPSERETVLETLRTNGLAVIEEGRFRRQDGSQGECVARAYALRDDTGQLSGVVGFLTDVTAQRKAEAALRHSEQQFRTLAEVLPHITLLLEDDRIVFANKASEMLFGYVPAPGDIHGLSLLKAVRQEDRKLFASKQRLARREGKREAFECVLVCHDGRQMDALVTISPVEHAGRRMSLVVIADLSSQKNTERILRDTEAKYHTLVDQAPFGVALLLIEPLRALIVNAAMAEIVGCSKDELLAMKREELLARVHPGDQPAVRHFMKHALASGLGGSGTVRLLRQEGTVRHVDFQVRRITLAGTAFLQLTAMDLTEKLQREAALRESEERYRAVVEDQTELICRRTANGTIVFVNEAYCRYFGKKPEELIGTSYMPAMPHEHMQTARDHFLALRPSRPTLTHEHIVLNAKGEERWMQWRVRAFFDERGRLAGMQSVGSDVTERRRAEQKAREEAEDLELVARINAGVTASLGLHRVLRIFAQGLTKSFGCKNIGVFLLSEDGRYLIWDKRILSRTQAKQIEQQIGMPIPSVKIDLEHSRIFRTVLLGQSPQVLADDRSVEEAMEECVRGIVPRRVLPGVHQFLSLVPLVTMPLVCGTERVGVLAISRGSSFSDSELKRIGRIAGALALAIKHQRLEQALRQSEERLRHMAESLSEGLAIVEGEKVLYANPRLRELFGYEGELRPEFFIECAAPEEQIRLRKLAEEAQKLGRKEYEAEFWVGA
ncbi:MAG: PAS domain S-box protein, partial [candidate division KSB1 bacterium]|nr:PAS domain S-box protein [candidate division KSB1 bacterium]